MTDIICVSMPRAMNLLFTGAATKAGFSKRINEQEYPYYRVRDDKLQWISKHHHREGITHDEEDIDVTNEIVRHDGSRVYALLETGVNYGNCESESSS